MKTFIIVVDHLAEHNEPYSYFSIKAKNLSIAKNLAFIHFREFEKVYLLKILATTKFKNKFIPVCNLYKDGMVNNDVNKHFWDLSMSTVKELK